jgi:SAM-dependent methyltransferase
MTALYEPFLNLLPANAHILDAGCDSGRDSLYFLKNRYRVTAIDASKELSKLASELIKQPVLNISFQEIDFEDEFDGVWASASLLHVTRNQISDVLSRVAKALKDNGVLYASFKYGDKEYEKEGRYYNCYDENSIDELINKYSSLTLIKCWTSDDARPNREDEIWLNCLLRKEC